MPTTTTTIDTKSDIDLNALADEAIEELYEGAPESFSDPGPETIPVEDTGFVPMSPAREGYAQLTNIRYPNETILLTRDGHYLGEKVRFIDGRLFADRETADIVKAMLPYVYEEVPGGYQFVHKASGFNTTSQKLYEEFTEMWAENNR